MRSAAANSLGFSKLACSAPDAEREHPRALERAPPLRFDACVTPSLLAVVEGKPEGVAEGGERPLGGIRLGALERELVRLARGRGFAFPGS